MRTLCLVLVLYTSSLSATEQPQPAPVISSSHLPNGKRDEHPPVTIYSDQIGRGAPVDRDAHGDVQSSRPVAALPASASVMPRAISTANATPTNAVQESAAFSSGKVTAPPCVDCAGGPKYSYGERSSLEAEKQLLTLQIDIVTLRKRLDELQSAPRPVSGRTSAPAIISEPPPTVLARRGFDGHFSASLRMSSGGNLVVHTGDKLPFGRIDSIDGSGVLATWYGRQVRLLDAELEEPGPGAALASRNLDLSLPAAPAAVSTR